MATSGVFNTADVGALGSSPDRARFSWSLSSQSEDGNWSKISWNIRGWGGASSGYWTYNFGTVVDINGSRVVNRGSQITMYHNGVFHSGTRTIGHNSNGSKTFGASSNNKIYWNSWNSSGSGSWALPSLYQEIGISSVSIHTVTDITFRVGVSTNRTANLLQLSINGGGWSTYYSGNYTSRTVTVGSSSSPLKSGTPYSVRVRVRRASNGNITDSGTYHTTTVAQNKFFGIGDY